LPPPPQNYFPGAGAANHSWALTGMGGGGGACPPPGNIEKCFLLQMSSKTSVDEVFMHHFEKMSGSEGEDPTGELP